MLAKLLLVVPDQHFVPVRKPVVVRQRQRKVYGAFRVLEVVQGEVVAGRLLVFRLSGRQLLLVLVGVGVSRDGRRPGAGQERVGSEALAVVSYRAAASACAVDQNFSGAFRRRDRYAFAGDNPVYLCRLNVDYDFVFDV